MQTHICSNASADLTIIFSSTCREQIVRKVNLSYSPICNKTGDYKAALKAIR